MVNCRLRQRQRGRRAGHHQPTISAGASQGYSYPVIATDPQGAALTYTLVDAPTGMAIGSTGIVTWPKPVAGTYNVTLRVDNGKAYAEQRYQLTVSTQAPALDASLVVTPAVVNLGELVTIDFASNGGTGNVLKSLAIDGQPVALTVAGQAVVTAGAAGAHQTVATATDSLGSITRNGTYSWRNLADSTMPVAIIATPGDDAEVTGPIWACTLTKNMAIDAMNSSNPIWWHIAVKAKVSFLSTADGGRAQPVLDRYRYSPNHKLKEGLFCMGSFTRIEGGRIEPGETTLVDIVFVVIEPLRGFFKDGMKWDIHEGSLKVGSGEILSVIGEKVVPTRVSRRIDQ